MNYIAKFGLFLSVLKACESVYSSLANYYNTANQHLYYSLPITIPLTHHSPPN